MKSAILDRYPMSEDGKYVIDITAGRINDLYSDFDRYTPYVRKELDQNLTEYLTDSAKDLGKKSFLIRFNLLETPDDSMKERITSSINNYFIYLKQIEVNELTRSLRSSFIYFFIGIFILFLSVWVSLWEALASFIVNWTPYKRQINLYERISKAPVLFESVPDQEMQSSLL